MQAFLDGREEVDILNGQVAAVEVDRAARLAVIEGQGRRLGEVEAERNILRADVEALREHRDMIEADRAARLDLIERQQRRLGEVEADANNLRSDVEALREHRDMIEADRAARLDIIGRQGRRLGELEAEAIKLRSDVGRFANIETCLRRTGRRALKSSRTFRRWWRRNRNRSASSWLNCGRCRTLFTSCGTHASYRLLRSFGHWGWMERAMGQSMLAAVRARPMQTGLSDAQVFSFAEYRASIDGFNSSQPNKALLDGIRAFNHETVNDLNKVRPLRETLVLDIGASPHGYALERTLQHGARLYVGIGLDVSRPQVVVDAGGSLGMLLKGDAASLPISSDTFDLVLSISTFEHVLDIDAVLSEIARVLRVGGQALLTFEPIWSGPHGHHLHHFGECAKVVPAWSHLTHTPEQFRTAMADRWPANASLSLDQAVGWVYFDRDINRLTVRDYRERFRHSSLEVEWMVDLKEPNPDESAAKAALATGLSVDDLTTKGLSVLLRKSVPR